LDVDFGDYLLINFSTISLLINHQYSHTCMLSFIKMCSNTHACTHRQTAWKQNASSTIL